MGFTVKSKPVSAITTLILWSIVLRMIVYFLLPPAKELEQYDHTSLLFFSALTDHFGDYLSHITLIPPVSYIINAFVFFVFGVRTALHIRAFIIMVSVMDIAAVALLSSAAKKAGAGKRSSFLLPALFSAVLIPFELWRNGMFYDHHTVFFASFFAWSLVTLIKTPDSYRNMIWVSVAGALLVGQSAVNAAIVPFSIVLIFSFVYIATWQFRKLAIGLVMALFLPVTVLVVIANKNKKVGEEALTSNKAGPAMMMVVQRSYNYDTVKIRSAIKESGAPEWYLWTYDHASTAIDKTTGKPDYLYHNLAQAFGDCFYSDDLVDNPGPYGFDFHPLLHQLRRNDSLASFTRLVAGDSVDALYKPYRLSGYSQQLAPAWIGIYGGVSKKIFFKTLLKNPVGMLRAFIIQQGIFSIYGPLFPFNTMRTEPNILVRAGLRSLPGKMPLDPLFVLFVLVFAVTGWFTYGIVLLNILFSAVQWIRNKKAGKDLPVKNYFLLMSIPVVLIALVFSCLVGGENDRYFMQVSPYIILLATLLPGWYQQQVANLKNNSIK